MGRYNAGKERHDGAINEKLAEIKATSRNPERSGTRGLRFSSWWIVTGGTCMSFAAPQELPGGRYFATRACPFLQKLENTLLNAAVSTCTALGPSS